MSASPSSPSGRPLTGRSVVVTRAADQAGGLVEPLRAAGAEVVLMPVIEVVDPADWSAADAAIDKLDDYEWIVITSVNGVAAFGRRLARAGRSLASLTGHRIATVGSATAAALRAAGAEPAIVPADFRAEGIVEAFREMAGPRGRVLIARAAEAREVLPDDLRAMGHRVDVVPVYDLATAPPDPGVLSRFARREVDAVTFASGGTAARFLEVLRAGGLDPLEALRGVTVASIGPVTTERLRELGVEVTVEAPVSTAASLVETLAAACAPGA